MITGTATLPKYDSQIKCAYSGCDGTKKMALDAKLAGFNFPLHFAGITHPYFEDAHRTSDNGKDLDPEVVLRVKWNHLLFFGYHKYLGPIEISMLTDPSAGRVYSLSKAGFKHDTSWLSKSKGEKSGKFFPAYNENWLYFRATLPRFGVSFQNQEPVLNGAIINEIPPLETEYELKQPVKFLPKNSLMPFSLTLENCRMSMIILTAVKLEVKTLEKTGENTARLVVCVLNESDSDDVRLAVAAVSTANITMGPKSQFIELFRTPLDVEINLDISKAIPPGTISISFILIEPYESKGANVLTIDYEEIRAGRVVDGVPNFQETGLAPTKEL